MIQGKRTVITVNCKKKKINVLYLLKGILSGAVKIYVDDLLDDERNCQKITKIY